MGKYDFSFSVSRLVNSLVESGNNIRNKKRSYKSNENGKYYHKILGFDGNELYESIIEYKGFMVRVYGSPDRVDKNKKVVEELKTYRFKENLEMQKLKGEYQVSIYCYLVGYSNATLYIYNVNRKNFEYVEHLYVSKEDQIRIIERALNIVINKLQES